MSSQSRVVELLQAAHADRRLTVREYADKSGLAHGTISNYLAGQIPKVIPDDTLEKLARAFGIPLPRLEAAHLADRGLAKIPKEGVPADPQQRVIEAIQDDPSLLPEAKAHFLNQYQLLLRLQGAEQPMTPDDKSAASALKRQGRVEAKKKSRSTPKS